MFKKLMIGVAGVGVIVGGALLKVQRFGSSQQTQACVMGAQGH